MTITDEQREHIRTSFKALNAKEDLVTLLNYSKSIIYEMPVPFELKQITYYSNTNINRRRYFQFEVRKKSGEMRTIHAPVNGLKEIQKCLNVILHTVYQPEIHKSAMGFIPNRSIVDNANAHAGNQFVFNMDLKDFFPSINQARVWGRLKVPPFNLSGSKGRLEVNNILSALCCHEMEVERRDENGNWVKTIKNVLPQGAPTSPILTNIICQRLDHYLNGVAKRFGLKYTRYADDITFSSMHNVYQKGSDFLNEVQRIINDQDFAIKDSKTRLQKKPYRQEVTGLVVNDKTNVKASFIRELRKWLYYWETYGYEKASSFFVPVYQKDKGHVKKGDPSLMNVIAGKLNYLKMVKGADNETYKKLIDRFKKLTGRADDLTSTVKASKDLSSPIDLSKHKPGETTKFLLHFRSGDGLKFLTHDFDRPGAVFDRKKMIETCKEEFDSLTRNEYDITRVLYARIHQFAFGNPKETWRFNRKKYTLNWYSSEVIEWTLKNPNLHPIRSEKFANEFILPFKRSIEIKAPELYDLVRSKLAETLEELYTAFDIDLVGLENANFYTDVEALQAGLSALFRAIKQRFHNSKKIKIEYSTKSDSEGRKRILKITHIGSNCDKPLEKTEIIKGDLEEAERAFYKVCDWSIVGKSPDPSINKLNILFDIQSQVQPSEQIDEGTIEGFTHILTFY